MSVVLEIKWNGREIVVSVEPHETVGGVKRVLEEQTAVSAKRVKLLGLKTRGGKPAGDDCPVSELAPLKPGTKIMMMG